MERRQKTLTLIFADMTCIFLAAYLSNYFLSYYVQLGRNYTMVVLAVYILMYVISAYKMHVFFRITRFFSIKEIRELVASNLLATIVAMVVSGLAFGEFSSVRFVILIGFFAAVGMVSIRILWRTFVEYRRSQKIEQYTNPRRLLLVGAGEGGNLFIQSQTHVTSRYDIVGFVDDAKDREGTYIEGYPVLGKISDIPEIVSQNRVDMITVTAPTLSNEKLQEIVTMASQMKVNVTRMPYVEKTLSGQKISSGQGLQKIDVKDLLGRKEVKLDREPAIKAVKGKKILITGAGGSIGSEICRQLVKLEPAELHLLGHGENSIYLIDQELSGMKLSETTHYPIIADVQDRERIFKIMDDIKPDIVYHAAAHKHVPLMEANPTEAVKNNVYGTKNVAEAADKAGVETFVLVSTDKANNPPNVMGATKRICEMLVTSMDEKSETNFVGVRFGNVLGSRGSVIPKFQKQIDEGGPVTVTDFRMTRYFMTIPEASRLVIQAGSLAKGGELFILDMGEPVKILDLAKNMIKLSGYTEEEIGIVEVGTRPGEKLYEELLLTDENTGEKVDEKIYVGKVNNEPIEEIAEFIQSLDLSGNNNSELKEQLIEFVHREA